MKKILLAAAFCLLANLSQAQLFIDNNYTIEDMILGFFGDANVTISNLSYTGTQPSLAFFEGSQSNIGLNAGLLITSGEAEIAIGPNDLESAGANMNLPGTPWLDALIPGYITYDAAVIEMDVVPSTDTLAFQYVFASEEYQEYVNTSFNDLFAFLIEGPGLPTGDTIWVPADTLLNYDSCYICVDTILPIQQVYCDSVQGPNGGWIDSCWTYIDTVYTWCYFDQNCIPDTITYPGYFYISPGGTNIAMVPNTNLPVAINTLNQFQNTQYFIDNTGGQTVQYDAFTTPLWASIPVIPGETYHVRIAVADAGDHVFDSGVFLGIESMGGDSLLIVEPDFVAAPNQGNQSVAFTNNTLWATEWHWNFGDGATSTERNPVHQYAADGVYNVELTASNWCSEKTYSQSVQIGTTGITETAADVFRIMPNPANGAFILDLKQDDSAAVRLLSLDGRLLFNRELADGARVDLSAYGNGVFILQVLSDGNLYTEKVVNER